MSTPTYRELLSFDFGLAIACPIDDNPSNCPLHEIRHLPVQERYVWLEGLSHEQRLEIFYNHKNCLCGKENTPNS